MPQQQRQSPTKVTCTAAAIHSLKILITTWCNILYRAGHTALQIQRVVPRLGRSGALATGQCSVLHRQHHTLLTSQILNIILSFTAGASAVPNTAAALRASSASAFSVKRFSPGTFHTAQRLAEIQAIKLAGISVHELHPASSAQHVRCAREKLQTMPCVLGFTKSLSGLRRTIKRCL